MEQKHICCVSVSQLPTKYPCLVAQCLDDQIFYSLHNPLSQQHYRCRVPELVGRRIRGCFHGWVILSSASESYNNVVVVMWNPVTCKTIHLPPLILEDGDFEESINQCFLSSPPDDHHTCSAVLMLTRTKTPTILLCQLNRELRWKEITYAKQVTGGDDDDGLLQCLTCCNGKVYGLVTGKDIVDLVQVDIVVKDKEVVISISLLGFGKGKLPLPFNNGCSTMMPFLKGYNKDLFYIKLGFDEIAKKTIGAIYLFKLDITNMIWEEMEDLQDAIFFLHLAHDRSVFYCDAESGGGGYIHILDEMGKVIYSYDVKGKTISLSSMPPCVEQSTYLSLWACRVHGDHESRSGRDEMMVRRRDEEVHDINSNNNNNTRNKEAHLLSIPLDVLRMIMEEYCGVVEYLKLRATCKRCRLAATPMNMIRWRLQQQTHSAWLLVLNKHQGIITFTDPVFGDKYFIKMPEKLIGGDLRICCCNDGWLLLYKLLNGAGGDGQVLFYNPFTKDIRDLPNSPYLDAFYTKEPPTSPDCVVVGISASLPMNVFIYCPALRRTRWSMYRMNFYGTAPRSYQFLTVYHGVLGALNEQGVLSFVGRVRGTRIYTNDDPVPTPTPTPRGTGTGLLYFIAKCWRHILLVAVDEFGESVDVFKYSLSTGGWKKKDSLGSHTIYICGSHSCLCMEAETPEMGNKVYFPRLHSKDGNIVFYSLETRTFYANANAAAKDFFGTKYHVYPHTWIQPTWS